MTVLEGNRRSKRTPSGPTVVMSDSIVRPKMVKENRHKKREPKPYPMPDVHLTLDFGVPAWTTNQFHIITSFLHEFDCRISCAKSNSVYFSNFILTRHLAISSMHVLAIWGEVCYVNFILGCAYVLWMSFFSV